MKIKGKLIILAIIIFIFVNVLVFFIINKDKFFKGEIIEKEILDAKINILMIEPDHLLSVVSNNKYVHEVCNLVFEGLTEDDDTLKAQPKLAKLILTTDNLSWDITLRDDVNFHNGDKFTANDVIFTIYGTKEVMDKYKNEIENIIESIKFK